ncbi:hypothetical protein ACFWBF_37155 [Streptomyces sp. NPDC060028]|uniref:hypothetical protein n=1 Tax=Streptomyces sp. NPDC060028 TaxID=3347041 RepID=UPI0036BD0324
MSPGLRVVVYPPDSQGGRAASAATAKFSAAPSAPVTSSSSCGGPAWTPTSSAWTTLLIEWRGGGPAVWSPDPGEE